MKDVSANFSQVRGVGGGLDSIRTPSARIDKGDTGFKDKLQALQNVTPATIATAGTSPLKFSNHAVDRMQARGIRFTPEQMGKIESAVSKAASKGAKDTLLLTDEAALIVSIKDKTVVTVMDKNALKENVFTNIDSTVMI